MVLIYVPESYAKRAQALGPPGPRIYREVQPLYVQYRWGKVSSSPWPRAHPLLVILRKWNGRGNLVRNDYSASRLDISFICPAGWPILKTALISILWSNKILYIRGGSNWLWNWHMVLRKIKRARIQILTMLTSVGGYSLVEKAARCGGAVPLLSGKRCWKLVYLTGDVKYP